jgi:holo-[acyl-carrier protein] synthase
LIVGSGIDLVEIARVERALARRGERFRERLFTPAERRDCERHARPGPHFALRFAAKEAGMKAIGTGWRRGVAWRDFEVCEEAGGLSLRVHGRAAEIARERAGGNAAFFLGASRTRTHALAQVVLESPPETGA